MNNPTNPFGNHYQLTRERCILVIEQCHAMLNNPKLYSKDNLRIARKRLKKFKELLKKFE